MPSLERYALSYFRRALAGFWMRSDDTGDDITETIKECVDMLRGTSERVRLLVGHALKNQSVLWSVPSENFILRGAVSMALSDMDLELEAELKAQTLKDKRRQEQRKREQQKTEKAEARRKEKLKIVLIEGYTNAAATPDVIANRLAAEQLNQNSARRVCFGGIRTNGEYVDLPVAWAREKAFLCFGDIMREEAFSGLPQAPAELNLVSAFGELETQRLFWR